MAYTPDLDWVDDAPPGFDTERMTKIQLGIRDAAQVADTAASTAAQAAYDASQKASRDDLVYRALDHGVTGDGMTDDAPALNDLISQVSSAGGGTVLLSAGTYSLGPVTLRSGVTLQGSPGSRAVMASSAPIWLSMATNATDVAIRGIGFDALGLATSYMLEISAGADGVTVEDCAFRCSEGDPRQGVETRDNTTRVLIQNCRFNGLRLGVRINRNPDDVTISGCEFTDWIDRAVQAFGTSTHSGTNLWITNNTIRPHRNAGTSAVRQPIQFSGDDAAPFKNVHVNGNTLIGPGTDFEDPSVPGSADMISLHRVDGFEVSDNIVIGGGDVGITIAQQCANGAVTGNVCRSHDSAGICIGSVNSVEVHNITVTGNVCVNNGQDRMGSTGTPDNVRCGIRFARATDCTAVGNVLGDDQVAGTQLYGVSLVDSTRVHLAANTDSNVTALYLLDGTGNASITRDSTQSVV